MVAIDGLDDDQATAGPVTRFPRASKSLADACTLVPTVALLDASVTVTLATVAAGAGAEILSELADPHADNTMHTIA